MFTAALKQPMAAKGDELRHVTKKYRRLTVTLILLDTTKHFLGRSSAFIEPRTLGLGRISKTTNEDGWILWVNGQDRQGHSPQFLVIATACCISVKPSFVRWCFAWVDFFGCNAPMGAQLETDGCMLNDGEYPIFAAWSEVSICISRPEGVTHTPTCNSKRIEVCSRDLECDTVES